MEIIKPIQSIYNMSNRMKKNNEQCPHVLQRLKALEKLALYILQKEPDQLSDDVTEALEKLNKVLLSAAELIEKFTEAFKLTQMVKSGDYKLEFENLNKSLTDAFVTLAGSLHVHQGEKLDKQETMLAEQENMLHEQKKKLAEQERKLDKQETMLAEQENMLAEQENMLHEQKKKLAEQERKLDKQETMLAEQENMLAEQENMLHEQKKKLAEQERKLDKQEDKLQRMESKLENGSRGYYCILQ